METMSQKNIILLGDQAVGKTSLVSQLIHSKCPEKHMPTVGYDFHNKITKINNDISVKWHLFDTSGNERFHDNVLSLCNKIHAAIVIFDQTNIESFTNIKKWNEMLAANANALKILIANKEDIDHESQCNKNDIEEYAKNHGFTLFYASIKNQKITDSENNTRTIAEFFDYIVKEIYEKKLKNEKKDEKNISSVPDKHKIDSNNNHVDKGHDEKVAEGECSSDVKQEQTSLIEEQKNETLHEKIIPLDTKNNNINDHNHIVIGERESKKKNTKKIEDNPINLEHNFLPKSHQNLINENIQKSPAIKRLKKSLQDYIDKTEDTGIVREETKGAQKIRGLYGDMFINFSNSLRFNFFLPFWRLPNKIANYWLARHLYDQLDRPGNYQSLKYIKTDTDLIKEVFTNITDQRNQIIKDKNLNQRALNRSIHSDDLNAIIDDAANIVEPDRPNVFRKMSYWYGYGSEKQ